MRPPGQRDADHHKPELAARPKQERHLAGRARRQPESASQSKEDETLDRYQAHGDAENEAGPRDDERGIDPGSDRNEVETEQEAAKRLDRELDLAAIFGFRQKQPGDKGAERHRQMARRGGQPVAQHHQEARRHEELRALRFGHEMEERPQGEAAENNQRCEAERRRGAAW